ncbi:DUF6415 family natural product biosynthesis protein [Streptomyces sp. NPDC006265]|uniref:DUF6415 family natural product biosynthesis protein n=1 Tax=Streptomyces sp. NPDC006265 TaxID=3156740 RepID=UPI0033BE5B74
MTQRTAQPDIATMRETVNRLLDPDSTPEALPPAADEIDTLTLQIRGHIALLAPEVEQAAKELPQGSVRRFSVLGCVWEANSRLETQPSSRTGGPVGHARRLARVLNALCDHYERLSGIETREQAALVRLGEHCASCPTCKTVDDNGANANLPCEEGDRLAEELRQARHRRAARH